MGDGSVSRQLVEGARRDVVFNAQVVDQSLLDL